MRRQLRGFFFDEREDAMGLACVIKR
ncbi:hypothetical protein SPHINGOAX6_20200 [Sphingomonas sp. AX6]|nr:hypothetical protein SPHINGOAX6_20200 [Sphingomonas sp. AX6]